MLIAGCCYGYALSLPLYQKKKKKKKADNYYGLLLDYFASLLEVGLNSRRSRHEAELWWARSTTRQTLLAEDMKGQADLVGSNDMDKCARGEQKNSDTKRILLAGQRFL